MASNDEFENFALAFEKLRAYDDVFAVIENFHLLSQNQAHEIGESDNPSEENFFNSELEARLWSLVLSLYRLRTSPPSGPIAVYSYSSNGVIQERYLRNNPKYAENWLILGWLQDTLPVPQEPKDLRGTKWMYSKNAIKGLLNGGVSALPNNNLGGLFNNNSNNNNSLLNKKSVSSNIINELDADAPLRSKRSIAPEDEDFDKVIFKYVFELVRARKYEEALAICEQTGNWSLKLTLSGANEYIDPEIDNQLEISDIEPKGIENKSLWQYTCRQLARGAENIDAYERGIYGILGGDLDSVLSLCDSWETQFISYLHNAITFETDDVLLSSKRINPDVAITSSSSSPALSTQKILNVLSNSSNPVISSQSQHLIRIIMGAIINNTLQFLVEDTANTLQQVMTGIQESTELLENPYILRILVHLILFLNAVGISAGKEEHISIIICSYIEILTVESKDHLIPLYVAYLPNDIAIDTYSYLLSSIDDEENRKRHLQLGKKYGLDMENTIRAAVGRIFTQTEDEYQQQEVTQITESIDESDYKLIHSIQWYIDSNLWPDAVHSISALYRRYLIVGKIGAAKEFSKNINISLVVKKYDGMSITNQLGARSNTELLSGTERIEVLEYDRLIHTLHDISKWDSHLLQQSNTPLWRSEALSIVDSISAQVHNLCEDWLQQDLEETPHIQTLRTIYLPYIILELSRVLISAQDVHLGFLKQAAQLAILVSDESQRLYELFVTGGQLTEFLSRISQAVTDGLVHGEEGIFEQ